jgi:hypothetical protein
LDLNDGFGALELRFQAFDPTAQAAFSLANGSGFGPRFLGDRAFSEPSARCLRQLIRFDE